MRFRLIIPFLLIAKKNNSVRHFIIGNTDFNNIAGMNGLIAYLKKTSLTFRIITGLVLGIFTGLFFGEEAADLQIIADVWIGLTLIGVFAIVAVAAGTMTMADFEQENESMDALIVEIEIGTAWTLLHPEYTVVVPKSSVLNIPLGFAVAKGQHDFAAMLGRWIAAKKATGEIQEAYDYWILGKGAEKKEPRWSISKDVLGWWQN